MTSQHDKANRWQFGIRDMFFVTLILGITVAWWVDHTRLTTTIERTAQKAESASLRAARSGYWSLHYQSKMNELSEYVDWVTVGEVVEPEK